MGGDPEGVVVRASWLVLRRTRLGGHPLPVRRAGGLGCGACRSLYARDAVRACDDHTHEHMRTWNFSQPLATMYSVAR